MISIPAQSTQGIICPRVVKVENDRKSALLRVTYAVQKIHNNNPMKAKSKKPSFETLLSATPHDLHKLMSSYYEFQYATPKYTSRSPRSPRCCFHHLPQARLFGNMQQVHLLIALPLVGSPSQERSASNANFEDYRCLGA